jgi:hypothetical protein
MAADAVVLAILDRVRREADGYYSVPVGLSDGETDTLRFSEAAARLLVEELRRVLPARR